MGSKSIYHEGDLGAGFFPRLAWMYQLQYGSVFVQSLYQGYFLHLY